MDRLDFDRLHELTFPILYGALLLLTFVLIERLIYYAYLSLRAGRIARAIAASGRDDRSLALVARRRDLFSAAVCEYLAFQRDDAPSRARVDDLSTALVMRVDARLHARLWLIDTIITGAPLLGLLGTIFGIMQTFGALSAGGISDPGEVSRGIGTALQATALGIGTALYGLVSHNALQRQAEHLIGTFKTFLLRVTF